MAPRRTPRAAIVCAVVAALALAGCSTGREGGAGREGKEEKVGHLQYNVYITRELNLKDVEDSGYYQGPEAPPGFALYGVFLTACNPATSATSPNIPAADDFTIIDTQGNRFRPLSLRANNIWAYHARPLKHQACLPKAG